MMRIPAVLVLVAVLLAGCAAAPVKPATAPAAVIETLQGSVAIALETDKGNLGGNGVLFFRSPDRFRVTVLAPFGQVLFDLIVTGDLVTCLMENGKQAWLGRIADLPVQFGLQAWPLLQWAMAPAQPPGPSLERSVTRSDGTVEKVYYDGAGRVLRKVNGRGDEVLYDDYRDSGIAAIPWKIAVTSADGSRLGLTFDEPEVNRPIEDAIFNPPLAGYELKSLARFRGF